MELFFIDIHTHQAITDEQVISIYNINSGEMIRPHNQGYLSSGIHPWFIDENWKGRMATIEGQMQQQEIIAIGECGLDRVCKTSFSLQEEVFVEQANIASHYKKILIIHCVRAYSDLFRIKKEIQAENPWIVHGFRGNFQIAKELIRHQIIPSFGPSLSFDIKLQEVFKKLSFADYFFESDDSETSIKDIYSHAAELLNISIEELQLKTFKLFQKILSLQKT